jgi:hypothetical protein
MKIIILILSGSLMLYGCAVLSQPKVVCMIGDIAMDCLIASIKK